MYNYNQIKQELLTQPKTWMITGVAGFIGSNILEKLLLLKQNVVGIDNLLTGSMANLDSVRNAVSKDEWLGFNFYNTSITDADSCAKIFKNNNIDFVLHHAAISSVPYSIKYPNKVKHNNIDGFNNILDLCVKNNIKNLVYASSSSVYGDNQERYKSEHHTGILLSPYAQSKQQNELAAKKYYDQHGLISTGLRYFNIYGKRQDHTSGYAAVIPKWIGAVLNNAEIYINGDGSTTRDFCHVDDVVMANILACFSNEQAIYNIGSGLSVSLSQLLQLIVRFCSDHGFSYKQQPDYRDFLDGDIRHSCANIKLVTNNLGFQPSYSLEQGMNDLIKWHINQYEKCLSSKF